MLFLFLKFELFVLLGMLRKFNRVYRLVKFSDLF